jgi:hypothetical protein
MKKLLSVFTTLIISLAIISCATTKTPAPSAPETITPVEETIPENEVVFDDTSSQPEAPAATTQEPEQKSDDTVLEPVSPDEAVITTDTSDIVETPSKQENPVQPEQITDVEIPTATAQPTTTTPANNPSVTEKPVTVTPAKPATATPKVPSSTPKATATTTKPATAAGQPVSSPEISVDIPAEETPEPKSSTQSSVVTQKPIVPSRSVDMLTNQYLDVIYPGTGWVYLGESDGSNLLKYFGRKLGTGDTTFSLRSSKAGSTLLHFYKNDILTGDYIDDYLAVTVSDKKALNAEHITAPAYADYVPPKLATSTSSEPTTDVQPSSASTTSQNADSSTDSKSSSGSSTSKSTASSSSSSSGSPDDSSVQTVIQTSESTPSVQTAIPSQSLSNTAGSTAATTTPSTSTTDKATNSLEDTSTLSSDDILSLAQKSFDNKKYKDALAYLDAFFDKAVTRLDEGLFLQGQTLESNSEVRNIKLALEKYDLLVKSYPQSIDWEKANERITYLKRFYFNIR